MELVSLAAGCWQGYLVSLATHSEVMTFCQCQTRVLFIVNRAFKCYYYSPSFYCRNVMLDEATACSCIRARHTTKWCGFRVVTTRHNDVYLPRQPPIALDGAVCDATDTIAKFRA